MPWIEVYLSVSRESAAATESALEQLGALAITLEDDADKPVLEPGPGETPLWPTVQVRGLFESGIARQKIIDGLQLIQEAEKCGNIQWREVADQDWERAWLERFQQAFGQ